MILLINHSFYQNLLIKTIEIDTTLLVIMCVSNGLLLFTLYIDMLHTLNFIFHLVGYVLYIDDNQTLT